METLELIGTALSLGIAAGLSLYGTAFLLGIAIRIGWLALTPTWAGLAVLAEPVVLVVAGTLFAIEILADKVPWIDSAWDAVHTAVRPVGGALLALRALGDLEPTAEVVAFLLLGGVTLATHTAKASLRLAVNTSPEPFSNLVVSLGENALLPGVLWLAVTHPLIALAAGLLALGAAVLVTAWLAARAIHGFRALAARARARASGPASGG